jgi:hypothetical protein
MCTCACPYGRVGRCDFGGQGVTMVNDTNHIIEHVFVDIFRFHGCNHNQS